MILIAILALEEIGDKEIQELLMIHLILRYSYLNIWLCHPKAR